jgi:hypothetical protein
MLQQLFDTAMLVPVIELQNTTQHVKELRVMVWQLDAVAVV